MAERTPDAPSDVLVELLALGELEEPEASELQAQLVADGDARLDRIAHSNAEILAQYPAAEEVELLHRRAQRANVLPDADTTPRRRARLVTAAVAVISLAAAVAIVWSLRTREHEPDAAAPVIARAPESRPVPTAGTDDGVRDKGQQRLVVHRQGDARALTAGQTVAAGDLLQLAYNAGPGRYGVIVSVDGGGGAVLHFPTDEGGSTLLQRGLVRLDHAFELDDAPGFERLFFVTSSTSIDAAQVLEAARRLASGPQARTDALALPEPWAQVSLLLPKRASD